MDELVVALDGLTVRREAGDGCPDTGLCDIFTNAETFPLGVTVTIALLCELLLFRFGNLVVRHTDAAAMTTVLMV